ncbi:MAG: hypothetical protein U0521_22495 [Anaerolineae bacterium]
MRSTINGLLQPAVEGVRLAVIRLAAAARRALVGGVAPIFQPQVEPLDARSLNIDRHLLLLGQDQLAPVAVDGDAGLDHEHAVRLVEFQLQPAHDPPDV